MLNGFGAEVGSYPVCLVEDFNVGNLLFPVEVGSWLFPLTQDSCTKKPPADLWLLTSPYHRLKAKLCFWGWVFFPVRAELLLLHHARFGLLELVLSLIYKKVTATFPSEALPYLVVL